MTGIQTYALDPWGRNVEVSDVQCEMCSFGRIASGEVFCLGGETYCRSHSGLAAVSVLEDVLSGDEVPPRVLGDACEILTVLIARARKGAMTNRTKWTSGPWEAVTTYGDHRTFAGVYGQVPGHALSPAHLLVARCQDPIDALLIAAAPDLYKALSNALDVAQWMSGSADFGPGGKAEIGWRDTLPKLDAARAALAKARGE